MPLETYTSRDMGVFERSYQTERSRPWQELATDVATGGDGANGLSLPGNIEASRRSFGTRSIQLSTLIKALRYEGPEMRAESDQPVRLACIGQAKQTKNAAVQ